MRRTRVRINIEGTRFKATVRPTSLYNGSSYPLLSRQFCQQEFFDDDDDDNNNKTSTLRRERCYEYDGHSQSYAEWTTEVPKYTYVKMSYAYRFAWVSKRTSSVWRESYRVTNHNGFDTFLRLDQKDRRHGGSEIVFRNIGGVLGNRRNTRSDIGISVGAQAVKAKLHEQNTNINTD